VASAGSILDLGCGVGLVLARLHQQRIVRSGDSAGWQSAPQSYTGFDASPRRIAVATECLGEWGDFQVVDIARVEFPPVDVIVLADVLHYLPAEDQDEVLQRAARSLRPGGALLLREADAGSGWGFVVTRISERLRALMRGDWRRSFCYRSRKEWASGMTHAGLDVAWQPAGQGTPFANVMLIGKAPPGRGT
jgi:SAM-dependent methyltransferase